MWSSVGARVAVGSQPNGTSAQANHTGRDALVGGIIGSSVAALGTYLVFGGRSSSGLMTAIAGLGGGLLGATVGAIIGSPSAPAPGTLQLPEPPQTPAIANTDTITGVDGPSGGNLLPVSITTVATGLAQPVQVTHAPGDDSGIYIVQQGGKILRHEGNQTTPFLDLSGNVNSGGERGLLSVAFHPNYATNGRLFVYYNDAQGDVNIGEVHAHNGRADASSLTPLLTVPHRDAGNHNGGQLNFGPDGMLYAGTGDGGGAGDVHGNAQNPHKLLGKMLRIDVDHPSNGKPYGIPTDNPFATGTDGEPEIYALGVRNPWRWSFDRATGDMWIGDVGQGAWEEVNMLPAGSGAGANLGWNVREGSGAYRGGTSWGPGHRVNPVLQYGHDDGAGVTGGFVYRGSAIPELRGWYVYADIARSELRALKYENGHIVGRQRLAVDSGMIAGFGEDTSGELYFTDYTGSVKQLTRR